MRQSETTWFVSMTTPQMSSPRTMRLMTVSVLVKEETTSAGFVELPGKDNYARDRLKHIRAWNRFVLSERKKYAKK